MLQSYAGPVAVMSFDPAMISAIAAAAPRLPRGLVAERKTAERNTASAQTAYLQRGVPGAAAFPRLVGA